MPKCLTLSSLSHLQQNHIQIGAKQVPNDKEANYLITSNQNHIPIGANQVSNNNEANYLIIITLKQSLVIDSQVQQNTRSTHIHVDCCLGVNVTPDRLMFDLTASMPFDFFYKLWLFDLLQD